MKKIYICNIESYDYFAGQKSVYKRLSAKEYLQKKKFQYDFGDSYCKVELIGIDFEEDIKNHKHGRFYGHAPVRMKESEKIALENEIFDLYDQIQHHRYTGSVTKVADRINQINKMLKSVDEFINDIIPCDFSDVKDI